MRGFRQSYEYLVDLCSDYDVVLIQELWLASFDLYKLDNVCNNICFNSPALILLTSSTDKNPPHAGRA